MTIRAAGLLAQKKEALTQEAPTVLKKNLIVREVRYETIAMIERYRHEVSLMEAFLRESVISARTYKRYFQKHSDPNLFLNTKLPPVQKSDQSEAV